MKKTNTNTNTNTNTAADIEKEHLYLCTCYDTVVVCADDDDPDLMALGREFIDDWNNCNNLDNCDYWDICEERSGWMYVSDDADLNDFHCDRVVGVVKDGLDTGGWYLFNAE